jgi:hypothetical protein
MKLFRIDLLTLLISLFILSSCKNQEGIGLNPDQQIDGTLLVDTNIVINTIKEDSVVTSALAKTPLGYFKDPDIGETEANIAFGLNLPSSSAYTLPAGTISIDSVLLIMRYADGFYGDSLSSKYRVNVYQLNEVPSTTAVYYNTKNWSYNSGVLVGSKNFIARPHTGFKITNIVQALPDTPLVVRPQVRIPLDSNFIKANFLNAPSTVLGSNTNFRNAIKGLYLTMDKTQQGPGGNFMMAVDSSFISIYCRANNAGVIDTAVISLPIGAHAAEIKHTYSASVQAALNDQATSNQTFYLQGLAGLRARISFPGLANIAAQAGGNIVINRAELVITANPGTTIPFQAQPKITMYQLDNTKQRVLLQDADPTDRRYQSLSTFGGYVTTKSDYHFIITGYIQDLMRGKTQDYGTYVAPVDTTNTTSVDYKATPQTGARLIAAGSVNDKSSPNYPFRIKLNIIYTKVH